MHIFVEADFKTGKDHLTGFVCRADNVNKLPATLARKISPHLIWSTTQSWTMIYFLANGKIENCITFIKVVFEDPRRKISLFTWAIPGLYFVYFRLFQANFTIFTSNTCQKWCPSSIGCWDSNPRPSGHESPPTTIRPGLPPWKTSFYGSVVPDR